MSKKIFLTALCLFTFTAVGLAQLAMPASEKVGVEAITPEIAPITAPFDMSKVVKPVFPARTVSIAQKGAKQEKLSTAAIQKAIDETSKKGGGTLTVPAGRWKTGRITLKSNVNLHIAEGAELHFSGDIKDYLPVVFTRYEGVEVYSLGALIYANGAENIALTGRGKLVGPGKDCEISRNIFSGTQIDRWQNPVAERVFDGANGGKVMPPHFFAPINCRNVLVEGVRFEKTVFWQVVPQYCRNVIIRGVTTSSSGTQRSDGVDIESSSDVLVEYCTLDCGDDCFTLKAGRCYDGVRVNRPTENVVIRYCRALRGMGGIVIGSETAGGFRNIYAHDCIFDGTRVGIRFKTRRNRGGWTENIFYERIAMKNVGTAFMFDLLGAESSVGDLARRFPKPEITPLTPAIKDIHVRDFTVENANRFLTVNAIPEIPLSNVLIENGTVTCKNFAPHIHDCDGFTLRNLQVTAESREGTVEGKNITFDNVRFTEKQLKMTAEHASPVIGSSHHDVISSGNRSGFETGQVVKLNGTYHMFVNEMFERPHRDMRIARWTSTDAVSWKREATVVASVQGRTASNLRAEVWLNSVVFNEEENAWNIFYVAYRGGDDSKGEAAGPIITEKYGGQCPP